MLVTFHNVSQSKQPETMYFALLQVSRESISIIFFSVNAQTETLNTFEYLQKTIFGADASRLHNKTSFNTEQTGGITSARPDMITLCTVEYSVLILILCKSAIRRLFSSVV